MGRIIVTQCHQKACHWNTPGIICQPPRCTPAEALDLAGVDYMTVSPSVLDSLQATATLQGYNDGLSGAVANVAFTRLACWLLTGVRSTPALGGCSLILTTPCLHSCRSHGNG
jgi:hypothetical protein